MASLLSIVIPVYNGEDTIGETLESVVNQCDVDMDMDIIISDNASTDNTKKVVYSYIEKYPFIHYYKNNNNVGFDKNCDLAIRRSKSEYCWIMGDDDLIANGGIKRIYDLLSKKLYLSAVYVNYSMCDRKSNLITVERDLEIYKDVECENGVEFFKIVGLYPNFISTIIVKRSDWVKNIDTSDYGSYFIHYAVLMRIVVNKRVYCISDPLVINKARLSGEKESGYFRNSIKVILSLLDIYKKSVKCYYGNNNDMYESVIKAVYDKYLLNKILNAKLNGCGYDYIIHRRLVSYFGGIYSFWLRENMIYVFPGWVENLFIVIMRKYKVLSIVKRILFFDKKNIM